MRTIRIWSLTLLSAFVVTSAFLALHTNPTRADGLDPAQLQDRGVAPELKNTVWLNTDKPLRLADLRGKVVLLEFWTFDCINCQHTLPAMKDFYAKYADQGLVVIGDHYPEFSFERDVNNVRSFVQQNGIKYPVAIDNDGATWDAYGQPYCPRVGCL